MVLVLGHPEAVPVIGADYVERTSSSDHCWPLVRSVSSPPAGDDVVSLQMVLVPERGVGAPGDPIVIVGEAHAIGRGEKTDRTRGAVDQRLDPAGCSSCPARVRMNIGVTPPAGVSLYGPRRRRPPSTAARRSGYSPSISRAARRAAPFRPGFADPETRRSPCYRHGSRSRVAATRRSILCYSKADITVGSVTGRM